MFHHRTSVIFTNLPVCITDEDHFLQEFAFRGCLWYNLPEHKKQLLDCVILQGHHEPSTKIEAQH